MPRPPPQPPPSQGGDWQVLAPVILARLVKGGLGGWSGPRHALGRTGVGGGVPEPSAGSSQNHPPGPGSRSGTAVGHQRLVSCDRHPVARFVLGVAAMAQHVGDAYLVLGKQLVEPLPEIGVHHGLEPAPFLALPALALPVGQPFADALGHILAVGHQLHPARALDATPGPRSRRPAPCDCWWCQALPLSRHGYGPSRGAGG